MGKLFIILGLLLVLLGLAMSAGVKFPSWFGKLPGDIAIRRENFSVYFPITTCVLISVLLTLILRMFRK